MMFTFRNRLFGLLKLLIIIMLLLNLFCYSIESKIMKADIKRKFGKQHWNRIGKRFNFNEKIQHSRSQDSFFGHNELDSEPLEFLIWKIDKKHRKWNIYRFIIFKSFSVIKLI